MAVRLTAGGVRDCNSYANMRLPNALAAVAATAMAPTTLLWTVATIETVLGLTTLLGQHCLCQPL